MDNLWTAMQVMGLISALQDFEDMRPNFYHSNVPKMRDI